MLPTLLGRKAYIHVSVVCLSIRLTVCSFCCENRSESAAQTLNVSCKNQPQPVSCCKKWPRMDTLTHGMARTRTHTETICDDQPRRPATKTSRADQPRSDTHTYISAAMIKISRENDEKISRQDLPHKDRQTSSQDQLPKGKNVTKIRRQMTKIRHKIRRRDRQPPKDESHQPQMTKIYRHTDG